VLDDFVDDAWSTGLPRGADFLEPAAARRVRNQTREVVTATGLADNHLAGGSVPIRFEAAAGAPLVRTEPGFAALSENLPRGFRYTVWSYTARPGVTALRRSPPDYPLELENDGMLDVGHGVQMPSFGAPGRRGRVRALLAENPALDPYVPLARLADRVAGDSRTPYGAVEKLETWFASSGLFRYSNHPTVVSPPLVGFVTRTRAGYCQYFAGAMALMLRYLGIPARVAVGFAGGQYDPNQHLWNISDREAHAWVEVWFDGYGWLPFDPTPAAPGAPPRGSSVGGAPPGLGARGLTPSEAGRARAGGRTSNGGVGPNLHLRRQSPAAKTKVGAGGAGRGTPVLILLAVLAVGVGGIVLTKAGVRLLRNIRRDPRSVAAACRHELASFLVDQRIEAPPSATLGELGELARHEFGVRADAFVAAAMAARFGPLEIATAAAVTARRELHVLLDGARRGLTRRERLRGLLSLRSLVRPATPVEAPAPAGTGG
jgi:transglutaminase-like putative cysteine protease